MKKVTRIGADTLWAELVERVRIELLDLYRGNLYGDGAVIHVYVDTDDHVKVFWAAGGVVRLYADETQPQPYNAWWASGDGYGQDTSEWFEDDEPTDELMQQIQDTFDRELDRDEFLQWYRTGR